MCLGVPMQVQAMLPSGAVECTPFGTAADPKIVEASLLDSAPRRGDWLLVHVNVAIRELDPTEARQIGDALHAVAAAAAGEPFEHLIADLIEREPELPPHLRGDSKGELTSG